METIIVSNVDFLSSLSSKNYLVVNKKLLKHYGPLITIFLSNLIDKYLYFHEHDQLYNNKWFFLIHQQQMEQTGMTETEIRNSKKRLIKDGVITVVMKGIPAKEWYTINVEILQQILSVSHENISPQDSGGLGINTSEGYASRFRRAMPQDSGGLIKEPKYKEPKYNETKNKERENISRAGGQQNSSKEKNIIPPPLELIEKYCQEQNSSVDPQTFYNWNTSKGWMIGKNKMKDWQAAIRTWELKNKQDSAKLKQNNNGFRNTNQKYREPDFIIDNTKTYNNG